MKKMSSTVFLHLSWVFNCLIILYFYFFCLSVFFVFFFLFVSFFSFVFLFEQNEKRRTFDEENVYHCISSSELGILVFNFFVFLPFCFFCLFLSFGLFVFLSLFLLCLFDWAEWEAENFWRGKCGGVHLQIWPWHEEGELNFSSYFCRFCFLFKQNEKQRTFDAFAHLALTCRHLWEEALQQAANQGGFQQTEQANISTRKNMKIYKINEINPL